MKHSTIEVLFALIMAVLILQACSDLHEDTIDPPPDPNLTTGLITEWNDLSLQLDRYSFGMRPNATARALAYIHLAGYETAVAEMEGYTSNNNRLPGFDIDLNHRGQNVDLNLALNTCYALVFDHFMLNVDPNIDSRIGQLKTIKENELSADLSAPEKENSIGWGTYVAQQVIAFSLTDTEAEAQIADPTPLSYEPPVGDGLWTYIEGEERAWFPYWGLVRTFVISPDQTASLSLPVTYSEDTSSAYYAQMNQVYQISTEARIEDNEDLWIAEFWSNDVEGLMIGPPGRQFSIAHQLIEQFDLNYESSLALLLKLGFSVNDAVVSAWADKYVYVTERPSQYIREFINPEYQTNLSRLITLPNPSFPGYPSGHAAFASAAAGVFIDQFGNAIDFTDQSHEGRTEFRGAARQFSSFTAMAEENAYSRVPLGVHIQADADEGLRLGYEISDAVNEFNLTN